MRKKIVAGNWKMNTTVAEGAELAKAIVCSVPKNMSFIALSIENAFTSPSSIHYSLFTIH